MGKTALWFVIALASLILLVGGCERKVVIENSGLNDASSCFTCHGDDGLILAAQGEWANSVHASGNNVDYTNRGGTDCTKCHDHQGFLDYLATDSVSAPYDQVSAIHCFTCHAPHETGTLALRTDDPYALENGEIFDVGVANLCANCHHSRMDVRTITDNYVASSRFASHHGPQADLLIGTGGYEYDGYDYHQSGHAGAVTDGCIGCHMGNPLAHNGYHIGGHSFNMVDEESGYDLVGICEDCHVDADAFDFTADEDYDSDGTTEGYQTEIEGMLEDLADLLVDAGVLNGTTHTPIADTIADAGVAGALQNYGTIEEDRSMGVHNFKYIYGLLESSIEYMESTTMTLNSDQLLAVHTQ
jgi:hypothetical protein